MIPYEDPAVDQATTKLLRALLSMLKLDHLNLEETTCVKNLVTTYADQLFLEGDELKGTNVLTHKIELTNNISVTCKPYKLPYSLQE